MRANIDGTPHRIVFRHRTEHKTLPPAKPDGPPRLVPVPFSVKAQIEDGDEHFTNISQARAVTSCLILSGEKPNVTTVRAALAVCSWSEKTFDKEFARQLALARVLEGLPRATGVPLLLAYLKSGPGGHRTLCDLSLASRGRYKKLPGAIPVVRRIVSESASA